MRLVPTGVQNGTNPCAVQGRSSEVERFEGLRLLEQMRRSRS